MSRSKPTNVDRTDVTVRHTPGPWAIDTMSLDVFTKGDGSRRLIATIPTKGLPDTNYANARLIAAAPELLELAQLIIKEWEKPTDGIQKGELIARLSQYSIEARALIRKATGEGAE
jgi:hypothetical protein